MLATTCHEGSGIAYSLMGSTSGAGWRPQPRGRFRNKIGLDVALEALRDGWP